MKPLILITNDDGIFSPGLKAAAEAAKHLGDLLIAAPRFQQTSMSRAFPKGDDIGKIESVQIQLSDSKYPAYAIYGSPAQVVSHAILEIVPRNPDLCISGINYGENLGTSLFPSGTIGAALEANTYGIPGLAINLEASISMQHSDDYNPLDWDTSIYFTEYFAKFILDEGLPPEIALLNVNIPDSANEETEKRVTSQSRQDYFVFKKPGKRDYSKGFRLKTEIRIDTATLEPDSDIQAFVSDRVVSVTPITWDLTAKVEWKRHF
jgi:5'-nucleotidase